MAIYDLTIGQSQTLPALSVTIIDPTTGVAATNLTGGSSAVQFVMRGKGTTAATVNAAATITNGGTGAVTYSWAATDTATPGVYSAQFLVTNSTGGTYQFPQTGFLEIEVQEALSSAPQRLIEIADAKDVLNIPASDRTHDTKILRWIDSCRAVIEAVTGPIILQTFGVPGSPDDGWYDGGQYHIELRRPPSAGYGTTPICDLISCSVYIGPIDYEMSGVASPDLGSIYTYEIDGYSRVVRRGPGGGIIPFPNMPQSVHVVYQAGQSSIPSNVYEGTLEMLRENYQQTAQAPRGHFGGVGAGAVDEPAGVGEIGDYLSDRVRQMLMPTRRAPSVA